jgi:chorismate mutase
MDKVKEVLPDGFLRDKDGVLIWRGGGYMAHYSDRGEAVKWHSAGALRLTCTERMFNKFHSSPCTNAPKHDPDVNGRLTKCGVHCKAAVAKREAKAEERTAKWKAQTKANIELDKAEVAVMAALRQIASGHNDPRALAQSVLDRLDAAKEAVQLLSGRK